MSGVKGLSGRKTNRDEEKRLRIIEKSWDIIEEYLNTVGIPLRDKAELASKLTVKDLPTQLEGKVEGGNTQVVIVREVIGNQSKAGELPGQISIIRE